MCLLFCACAILLVSSNHLGILAFWHFGIFLENSNTRRTEKKINSDERLLRSSILLLYPMCLIFLTIRNSWRPTRTTQMSNRFSFFPLVLCQFFFCLEFRLPITFYDNFFLCTWMRRFSSFFFYSVFSFYLQFLWRNSLPANRKKKNKRRKIVIVFALASEHRTNYNIYIIIAMMCLAHVDENERKQKWFFTVDRLFIYFVCLFLILWIVVWFSQPSVDNLIFLWLRAPHICVVRWTKNHFSHH